MWLFTKHGFYSVTRAKTANKKGLFQIRSRHNVDLDNLKKEVKELQHKKIHCYPDADYRYRVYVWPSELTKVMERLQDTLDYSNFKNEVHANPNQAEKYSYYTRVWGAMYQYQTDKEQPKIDKENERRYGQQLNLLPQRTVSDFELGSEHEPDARELNDYRELRELPYTDDIEQRLYGG